MSRRSCLDLVLWFLQSAHLLIFDDPSAVGKRDMPYVPEQSTNSIRFVYLKNAKIKQNQGKFNVLFLLTKSRTDSPL